MTVFIQVKKEDLQKLLKNGFVKEAVKTIHEEVRLKKEGVNAVLYTSGKLLLQGHKGDLKQVEDLLVRLGIGEKEPGFKFWAEDGWVIGSDESLKGDTFGGLVVAAVKADKKIRQELIAIGVADSKTLQDKEIFPLAEKIKKIAPCEVKSVFPEEYNRYSTVTNLLNKLHLECATYLAPGTHIVDKYPGCAVGNIQEEKADSKYAEVAAASILARAGALEQLNFLSAQAGFQLPKGSTHVKEALMELKKRGADFKKFVKMDFRNVQEFLS